MTELGDALAAVAPLDAAAMAAARAYLDRLTKPPGSLGRLEELAVWLAGVTGRPAPAIRDRLVVVAAADHGVAARGVSAWPSEVTAQMVANFVAGGAAITALAPLVRARVVVLDVGIAGPIPGGGAGAGATLRSRRIRAGTADLAVGPAMTRAEAEAAIGEGLALAAEAADAGVGLLATGEMGIGNTTAASAVVAALTGRRVADVTGRGAGLDDEGLAHKVATIEAALDRDDLDAADPLDVLAAVGGLEIAALVGLIAGAAAARIPLVLDGFITGAAALVVAALQPAVAPRLLAAHRSTEPGHAVVLDRLGLRPLLELDLRLGEGSGAALALGLLDAAVAIRDGMASFASAGVSERPAER
jgi:nicotinate-nucleotide--dimethylbenzimidazole phosphoribosyltransferase